MSIKPDPAAESVAAVRVGYSYAGQGRSRLLIQQGQGLRAVRWWTPKDLGLVLRALLIDGSLRHD